MALFGSKDEDDRLANSDRSTKRDGNDLARADRLSDDRSQTEDRDKTDTLRGAERYAVLRDVNTLLPIPPDLPGYHLVWLTTTNNKDPIENRQRLGYELVKRSELPTFALNTQKSSELTEDRIVVNEMILAKIPMDLWKEDMITLHHTDPLAAAKNLSESVQISKDGKGRDIGYTGGEFKNSASDGYQTLGKAKTPTLAGIR